ncbi:MAG: tetratricopeptide repeat protein [Oscillochloridaceae bacterium umkhey_bin13]
MRYVADKLPLILILLLALAWRAMLWAQPLHQLHNDEVEYVQVARDLLAGRGWSFYEQWRWLRAPLYPLFLAGSLQLAGGDLHLAAWPNLLLSVVLVGLIYQLTREVTPDSRRGPALLAALIAALLQTYATFASLYMSETLFSVLFTAALLALARWRRRGGLAMVLLAGVLFGLACLTRSAGLVMLPAAALWLTWLQWQRLAAPRPVFTPGAWRQGLAHLPRLMMPALALGVATVLVIAPWTIRNCQAYGSCILIETGGAYNLWAFYEPRESLETINLTLEAIPNPVDRADEATRRGMERLREDPMILLRKLWPEWERLWSIKPIQDRFLLASWYSDPPPAIFISALVLDDLLYTVVLIASAAGMGLALARRDPLALLMAAWLILFVAASLVTHTEGRYRHFFFMVLIPLAALALHELFRWLTIRRRASRPTRRSAPPSPTVPNWIRLLTGIPVALALLPLILYYPLDWASSGASRSLHRALGDLHVVRGQPEAAEKRYWAALDAERTPDGWLALGDLRRSLGDPAGAERYYQLAHETIRTYVGATAVWGDLLREQARFDEARTVFRGTFLDQAHLTAWSFLMREPIPQARVQVGDGLDFGYVGGVYLPEAQQGAMARWTTGRAQIRLRASDVPPGEPLLLSVRVAAPRPDGSAVPLRICVERHCTTLEPAPTWRTFHLLVPNPTDPVELRSPTFSAPDRRDLGVLLDWAALRGLP